MMAARDDNPDTGPILATVWPGTPLGDDSIGAMQSWGANVVRVALGQADKQLSCVVTDIYLGWRRHGRKSFR